MYLCYIDESGNTGANLKDKKQPTLFLTGLLVPPGCVRKIEQDIRTLSYGLFGAESRNTDFEFHGDEIYNGRGKYFKKLDLAKRIDVLSALVDILLNHDEIRIGYVSIDKERYYSKLHVQQAAFHLFVEKLEEHLQGYLKKHCLLIADEQDEIEQNLIDDLDHFKQYGTTFGYKSISIEWIIDSVHFVRSHNNDLMQLTDVVCYLLRRGTEIKRKLMRTYLDQSEHTETPRMAFIDWVKNYDHLGAKFFCETYFKLRQKGFLFSKNFPR